jgi:hypothetical protein
LLASGSLLLLSAVIAYFTASKVRPQTAD